MLLFRFGGVYDNSIPWTRREHGCGMISPFCCDCLHGCAALVLLSFGVQDKVLALGFMDLNRVYNEAEGFFLKDFEH